MPVNFPQQNRKRKTMDIPQPPPAQAPEKPDTRTIESFWLLMT